MARVLLLNIFMFLVPFILYGAYLYLTRRDEDGNINYWSEAPILWLFGAGLFLVAVAIVSLITFTGAPPGGTYVPPQVKDGVVVPGRIE